jgi:hypothetical protein
MIETIATPIISHPLTAGGNLPPAVADALNALFVNQAAIVGIGQASLTSADRIRGARDAGNSFWEIRQFQAAHLYV